MFDQYQSYIMDNADLSEVNIYSGNSLLEAAESGYLLEEFKSSWMEKELAFMIIMQKESPVTGMTNTMAINTNYEEFKLWSEGMLIQNAMPNTTTDEREFLISGCTPTCWDAMYPSEEEA